MRKNQETKRKYEIARICGTEQIKQERITQESAYGKKRNQYHPAFCAAMQLELREDREHLFYDREYNLNTMPNRIDLVVVNSEESKGIKSSLGAIFKKHNLFEFKSPGGTLDVLMYYRSVAYANLYAVYGKGEISMEEITLSFIRKEYPRKLMKWFHEQGFEVIEYEKGIYHIKKLNHIDMQVVTTKKLGEEYTWLKALTAGLNAEDIMRIRREVEALQDENELVNAEAVLDLISRLNGDSIKEVDGMGAFKELFREELTAEIHEKFKSEIAAKEDEIAAKEDEIAAKEDEIAAKEDEIAEQKGQIQNLNSQLKNKDKQLQNKNRQLKSEKEANTKLQKEIEQLKQQLKEQMNKIAML